MPYKTGLKQMEGLLIIKNLVPESAISWELFDLSACGYAQAETKGKDWLKSGWSLDAITTPTKSGFGIAKDIYENKNLEIDIGDYLTQEYRDLWKGKLDPGLGLGLNIRF